MCFIFNPFLFFSCLWTHLAFLNYLVYISRKISIRWGVYLLLQTEVSFGLCGPFNRRKLTNWNFLRDEVKVEDASAKEETVEKEKESEDVETKTETKTKESEKKDQKKDVKTEEKKEEKKETKQVKKEEQTKKTAVKKEEKKTEKKPDVKDDKKPDEKKSAADAKKSGTDAKKKETGKSLWVSNLSSMTRAADLKTRFTQYGKVSTRYST